MWRLLSQPICTVPLPMWMMLPWLDREHRGLVIRGYGLSVRCRLICLGIAACHVYATPQFVEMLYRHSGCLKADLARLRRDIGAWRRAAESRIRAASPVPFVNPWV